MKISFETREEKEDWIEENSIYDKEEDVEYYVCPCCHTKFEDFDEACDCCPCSTEEAYGGRDNFDEDDEDY